MYRREPQIKLIAALVEIQLFVYHIRTAKGLTDILSSRFWLDSVPRGGIVLVYIHDNLSGELSDRGYQFHEFIGFKFCSVDLSLSTNNTETTTNDLRYEVGSYPNKFELEKPITFKFIRLCDIESEPFEDQYGLIRSPEIVKDSILTIPPENAKALWPLLLNENPELEKKLARTLRVGLGEEQEAEDAFEDDDTLSREKEGGATKRTESKKISPTKESDKESIPKEQGPIGTPKSVESFHLENKAISDVWTCDDKLGYKKYAKAIADPILGEKTKSPLVIAIQAPWGQGKSSLMKMIQVALDPDSKDRGKQKDNAGAFIDRLLFKDLFEWMKVDLWEGFLFKPLGWFKKSAKVDNQKDNGLIESKVNQIPTVWFNPLYYQKSEQIWAGLAHAILHQLAGQIPSRKKREEFWFRLQLNRLDTATIRRDFHLMVLGKLIPAAVVLGFVFLWALFFSFSIISSLTIISGYVYYLRQHWKVIDQKLEGKFEKYVREPNYEDKLGLLHFVDTDLDQALDLLLKDRPFAVFIDDLDRCPPAVISEVVLAINQFLSVHERKTFFFLGMDMEIVASAIEESQGKHLKDASKTGNNFGWHFLDKFIQLPFFIPRLDESVARAYLDSLLERKSPLPSQGMKLLPLMMPQSSDQTNKIVPESFTLIDNLEKIKTGMMTDISGPEMEKIEEEVSGPLSQLAMEEMAYNPRTIKRFLNLARLLYTILVLSKSLKQTPEETRRFVVKATHLILNWPRIVRWLQGISTQSGTYSEGFTSPIYALENTLKKSKDFMEIKKEIVAIVGESLAEMIADPKFCDFIGRSSAPTLSELINSPLFLIQF